jgi:DNA phosphorothioation-associated putative methyltransferase
LVISSSGLSELSLVSLYATAIRELDGGKRVNDAVYMHLELIEVQSPVVRKMIEGASRLANVAEGCFTVVRISRSRPEIALLDYPDFCDEPFPALRTSWLIDLTTERVSRRDFLNQENSLILHRKELMLPEHHPDRAKFTELTTQLEDFGAFDSPPNLIGRRLYWEQALHSLGIRIEDHRVVVIDPNSVAPRRARADKGIARHRTAISRKRLSSPMQALARWGFINAEMTVLDYGCGRGDDVRALRESGVSAAGWDPHFAPNEPVETADVVNLGFVLNVIEDQSDRTTTLRRAFALAGHVLSVAVMLPGDGREGRGSAYADGVLTHKGTFQRYFSPTELREYVSSVLGRDPVMVGTGLVFVFRTDEEEQAFLALRQRSAIRSADSLDTETSTREERISQKRTLLYERHQVLLDTYWAAVLEFGRLPESWEFDGHGDIVNIFGSARRAFAALPFPNRDADLARSAKRRADDLLAYLALNVFERRRSAATVPASVQRDLRCFFGSQKAANERARTALFESGTVEHVIAAAAGAAAEGLGVLAAKDGDYTFHASLLHQQPIALRILVGCAEQLEPIPADIHLLKVHGTGNRVSYLSFDDFDGRPFPMLKHRVVVDLRRQRVEEVPVKAGEERRVLLGKARLMRPDAPGRDRQERFDELLRQRGVLVQEGLGPSARVVARRLAEAGIGRRNPNMNTKTTAP